MTTPRKRIITIKLTARDKNDPQAMLDAVRAACRKQNVEIRVFQPPDDQAAAQQVALELLETVVMQVVAKELDEKANKAPEPTTDGRARQIAGVRKTLWGWFCATSKKGWEGMALPVVTNKVRTNIRQTIGRCGDEAR